MNPIIDMVDFDEKGLIPAIIQDDKTGRVLTLCYMNREALKKTVEEGKIYVYRRSKAKLMMKGEKSGCVQTVKSLHMDCEGNSLLFKVDQKIAACHDGYFTCYFREIDKSGNIVIKEKRIFNPKEVY